MSQLPFQPGRARHRIAIQAASIARGASGAEIKTWADEFEMSVEFVSQGAREFYQAKSVVPEMTHLLRGRWRQGVSTEKRVRYHDFKTGADRFFDIRGAENPDESRWIVLIHCRELIGREAQS